MDSYMMSAPAHDITNSFPVWKRELWPPTSCDYNYRKSPFTGVSLVNDQAVYQDSNSYSVVNLMDLYSLGLGGPAGELLDISDLGMPELGPGSGNLVGLPQHDVVLPDNSGFMQPLLSQEMSAPLSRPYAFPSPGLSPENLANEFGCTENTESDLSVPVQADGNINGTFPDFGDLDTDDSDVTDSSLDGFSTLRNLLVAPAEHNIQTRERSRSDGELLRYKRIRNLNDRRHSDAGVDSDLHSSKKARCFWQYNLQAKGPKRDIRPKKLSLLRNSTTEDPHVLKQPDDPVFDPVIAREAEVKGVCVQHTGKARRGNGNDLTADPKKLFMIGAELDQLNETISSVMNAYDGCGAKQAARKEKNKLTSRVCRLKKKAQHEANKIKLQGLQEQHRELIKTLQEIKALVRRKVAAISTGYPMADNISAVGALKAIRDQTLKTFVCGRSLDFVNEQIEKSKERNIKMRPGMRNRV